MRIKPRVRRSFSRRHFFKGLGYASLIAQPLWRAHTAWGAVQPKVIIFYKGGGLRDGTYYQKQLAHNALMANATLTNGLDVFEEPDFKSLKSKLAVMENIHFLWGVKSGQQVKAHGPSASMSLTAAQNNSGRVSMDRFLADKIGGGAFKEIRFKIIKGQYDHSEPGVGGSSPPTYRTPSEAYDAVFSGFKAPPPDSSTPAPMPGTPAPVSPELLLQRDLLSFNIDECNVVVAETERQLGAEMGRRVKTHCDSIRDMEKRLNEQIAQEMSGSIGPVGSLKCAPQSPSSGGGASFSNLTTPMSMFQRVAVNALACGRTRVVLYEMYTDQPEEKAQFLKGYETMGVHTHLWHSVVDNFGDAGIRAGQLAYTRLMMRKFAEFMKFSDDLGLLEETVILMASNEPNGGHSFNRLGPFIYGGKGGGTLVTGKYWRPTGIVGINDAFTSFLRGLGLPMEKWGDDNSGRARYGLDEMVLGT